MREVGNLKRIGEQYSAEDSGTLSIATTHTQARYVLPGRWRGCARPTPRSTSACTRARPTRWRAW
jgi:LysR family cys regulon transcriptional activator